jgi:hypothetical protein
MLWWYLESKAKFSSPACPTGFFFLVCISNRHCPSPTPPLSLDRSSDYTLPSSRCCNCKHIPPHPTKTDQFDNGASQHLQHQRPPPHIPPNTSIPPPFFNPVEPPPPYYTMDGSTAAAAMQSSFNHVCN